MRKGEIVGKKIIIKKAHLQNIGNKDEIKKKHDLLISLAGICHMQTVKHIQAIKVYLERPWTLKNQNQWDNNQSPSARTWDMTILVRHGHGNVWLMPNMRDFISIMALDWFNRMFGTSRKSIWRSTHPIQVICHELTNIWWEKQHIKQ